MIKKIFVHILFFAMLIVVYVIFCMIYSREIDIEDAVVFYAVLTVIVFCFNQIKARKMKWGILLFWGFLLSSLMYFGKEGLITDHPLDILGNNSPINIPVLPQFGLAIDNFYIRVTILCLIYFWGAIAYWYCIYFLSKKAVQFLAKNKIKTKQKDSVK